MSDTGPATQLPEAVKKSNGEGKSLELPTEVDFGPSNQEQQPQKQPRQNDPTKLPQGPKGKGRIDRFKRNINAPYIQRPEPTNPTPKGKERRKKQAPAPAPKPTEPANNQEKDELVKSVQVPDHIIVDTEYLHVEPPDPEPQPVAPVEGTKKKMVKRRPPPIRPVQYTEELPLLTCEAVAGIPFSPPQPPPRPLQLADNEHGTTLYELLEVVNRTLAAEMNKKYDIKLALAVDVRGPMRSLGYLGNFVKMLFKSMNQHHKNSWRQKKAAAVRRRPRRWPTSEGIMPPAPPPFRKALTMFSVPVAQFSQRPVQVPQVEAVAYGSEEEYYDEDNGEMGSGEEGEEMFDEHFSIFKRGIAKPRDAFFEEGPKNESIYDAFRRSDRLRNHLTSILKKRTHEEYFAAHEESSTSSESEPSSPDEAEFFKIPSPSLPTRMNQDDLFPDAKDEINTRRYETFSIKEKSKEEEAENKRLRREARAVDMERRKAHKMVQLQARKSAEAAIQKQLADLENERDAALYLAETAVYARDELEDEKEALLKDGENLRRLVKALMGKGEIADPEERDRIKERVEDERDKQVAPPATNPNTPEAIRQRILDEAERIVREGPPQQRPQQPSAVMMNLTYAQVTTRVTYQIHKMRAPLVYGFIMSVVDIVYALLLMIWRQKQNIFLVLQWLAFALLGQVYFELVDYLPMIWSLLHQRLLGLLPWQKTSSHQEEYTTGGATPTGLLIPGAAANLPSRNNQLDRFRLRPPQKRLIRFPRDALAELTLFACSLLAGLAAIAAVTERNLWLDANGGATDINSAAESQRRFLYGFVLQHREDTDSCDVWPATHPPGPYHVCGCVPTVIDPRMIFWTSQYFTELAMDRFRDFVQLAGMWASWALNGAASVVK
ncbi:hypothetical protein SEUCBS139899_006544 [Sporothrix eucalyptigena]|uniref:Uncharacterized protein n=1 Tax=Sporothrix eucalyptigena TaxID=1812306 RepID=A0ABP0B7E3_9PEZI